MTNAEILREIGLTQGEISVYYALFEVGESSVGPISKLSRITHAKVYPILEKLISKGLISHTIKDGRKHFSPSDPNRLVDYIETKVEKLEEEKTIVKELIPELISKKNSKEQIQYSRTFEGTKGLRTLFKELFRESPKNTEICVLGLNELLNNESVISFFRYYHDLRKENKITLRLILNKSSKKTIDNIYITSNMFSKKDSIKYVNTNFPTGVFIFRDHVISIVSEKVLTAFDIKSEQNANRYRDFFNSIWDN
jgi:sugar-specific transcriptional regulator TrmB